MKQTRTRQVVLAAAALACGTMGSIEWSSDTGPPHVFLRGDFTISASTAAAGETRGAVRSASCALVRYYVARYTAAMPRRGLAARARRTPRYRPPGAVSSLNKPH